MRKIIHTFILVTLVLFLMSCEKAIIVPDIKGVDEETAKSVLVNNEIVPKVSYEYSNSIIEGNVIRTNPAVGVEVEKNQSIIVYVSKGPKRIESSDSRATLFNIYGLPEFKNGEWGFYSPYIEDEILFIDVFVTFKTSKDLTWQDLHDEGKGFGTAAILDNSNKQIPFRIIYAKDIVENSEYNFTIQIPISELKDKPTSLAIVAGLRVNDTLREFKMDFTISW